LIHLRLLYLVAKLLQAKVVGILSQKPVDVIQGSLMIPGGYHLIHLRLLYLVAKLLQAKVVGILG